jgi:hypothetical protein
MDNYICPVCKEAIEHDLVVFLKHTDHHIIEIVLKEHPQWRHEEAICRECLDYYKKTMGHKPYMDEA